MDKGRYARAGDDNRAEAAGGGAAQEEEEGECTRGAGGEELVSINGRGMSSRGQAATIVASCAKALASTPPPTRLHADIRNAAR